jgi:hypothetical protein
MNVAGVHWRAVIGQKQCGCCRHGGPDRSSVEGGEQNRMVQDRDGNSCSLQMLLNGSVKAGAR